MNLENDLFMLKKNKMMQLELAEAASEYKTVSGAEILNEPPPILSGSSFSFYCVFLIKLFCAQKA